MLIVYHANNGYENAPQFYVIRTWLVFFDVILFDQPLAQRPFRIIDNSCHTRIFFMEGHWSYEITFTRLSKNLTKRVQSPRGQSGTTSLKLPPLHSPALSLHTDFPHYNRFQQDLLLSFLPTAPNKNVAQSHEYIPRSRFVAVRDCVWNLLLNTRMLGMREKSITAISLLGATYFADKQFTTSDGQ